MLSFMCILFFSCLSSVYLARLPPKLSYHPSIQSQNLGTRLKILCSVQEGDPPFTFVWHKNGQKFFTSVDENHHKLNVNEYESELTITKLNENDSGNYTCLVRNSIGSDRQTTMVVVKGSIIQYYHFITM